MKTLTLSIVIPVYNEEEHIEACLDAIKTQTLQPDEVIIVDNNCTDATITLAGQYDFVRVIKQPMPGIAHARNAGFDAASSDLIARIDADTRLPTEWVAAVKTYLTSNPQTLLSGGSYMYDMAYPRLAGWVQGQLAFRVNKFILGHYIAWGSNMAFHRDMWRAVRHEMHNDRAIHEDIDLSMHLDAHGYHIAYQPSLKVGIESRLFSDKRRSREQHMHYLKMWPITLEKHHLKRAWVGWLGVYVVYFSYLPLLGLHKFGMAVRALRPATDQT